MAKRAGIGGAFYVTLIIFGLAAIVGVIVWMMWTPSGIRHSPKSSSDAGAAVSRLAANRRAATTPGSR